MKKKLYGTERVIAENGCSDCKARKGEPCKGTQGLHPARVRLDFKRKQNRLASR